MQSIRGFRDILPEEIHLWQKVEKEVTILFNAFGYKEIRIPVIEKTDLFVRSIGEITDIVEKEMYTFEDRNGGKVTLRPEATASICRSYIQHKMYNTNPVRKFFMIGPMFRRERPQKGRYRQFYQIDVEVFGIASAYIDSELIFLLHELFKRLGLKDLNVHINSLGCSKCRPVFQQKLLDFLYERKSLLCENCVTRMHKNPLRILDCKNQACNNAMQEAPVTLNYLCPECKEHFMTIQSTLKRQKINFTLDKSLVRGLDYYTRTAWEVRTTNLGAQSAVAGGGRYDGLISELGGPSMPAIGFAIGFDRLTEVMEQMGQKSDDSSIDLFILPMGKSAMAEAYKWFCELNLQGIRVETDFRGKSMKSLMKLADKLHARYVLICGDNELANNRLILRNMETKDQISIDMQDLIIRLIEILKR